MESYLLQLVVSAIGCILGGGGLVGLWFFIQKRRIKLGETLFLEYKNIAQELAIVLEDLLSLSLNPQYYSYKKCMEIDKALSSFFFKYYLVLPQDVLLEINCLHACLNDTENRLFIVDKREKLPLLRPRTSDEEIVSLLNDVALVKKGRGLSDIYLEYHILPRYMFLKCQARHVITILGRSWNMRDLYSWSNNLSKHTLAERINEH